MKRHWKQGTALLLSAAMVLGSSSLAVFAEEPQTAAGQEETYAAETVSEREDTEKESDTVSEASTEETTEEDSTMTEAISEPETEPRSEEQETSEQTGDATIPEENIPMQMMQNAAPLDTDMPEEGKSEEETETEGLVELRMHSEWASDSWGQPWSWVYVGQEQTFSLADEELEQFGDCEIVWECTGTVGAEVDQAVQMNVSADGRSCIMTGMAGHEMEQVGLTAEVFSGGRQVGIAKGAIQVRKPVYEYKVPSKGDAVLLPWWETGLCGNEIDYYVEDAEHPYGENGEIEIMEIRIDNPDVVGVKESEDEWGKYWTAYAKKAGHASITLVYKRLDNTVVEYPCKNIQVVDDLYGMKVISPVPRENMRPGTSMDLTVGIWHFNYDADKGHSYLEDDPAVYIEWSIIEGSDIISIETDKDNSKCLHVMSNADVKGHQSAMLEMRAMLPGDDGSVTEVTRAEIPVHVDENYKPKPVKELRMGEDGKFYYYIDDVIDTEYEGFVEYDGGHFYVKDGTIVTEATGLWLVKNNSNLDFYFLAQGQLQSYTGLVEYDGEWFYIEGGKLVYYHGIVEYDGGKFIVAYSRIAREANGLWQDPTDGKWYFAANGQIQTQHTGVAAYDGELFYVMNGELATDYKGTIKYNGVTYNVVNGQLYKKK